MIGRILPPQHGKPGKRENDEEAKGDSLVLRCSRRGAPHAREPLVKPELLPHLEALLAAERAALDQAMDAPMRETILVAVFVKPT